ncbi:MAG TPA: hypothetical protein VMZ53_02350 [Kofleriaceae bacterium]|nr:hypothetical protein [Kofleriaceae bacterium]
MRFLALALAVAALLPGCGKSPSAELGECQAVAEKSRELRQRDLESTDPGSPALRQLDKIARATAASCAEDHWPRELRECVMKADTALALAQCHAKLMPPEMQRRVSDRVLEATK